MKKILTIFSLAMLSCTGANADNWIDYAASSFSELDEANKVINIKSANELALVAKNVYNQTAPTMYYADGTDMRLYYGGWTINLSNDIDLSGHDWTPIGCSNECRFYGVFNGNGHTVSNMTITNTTDDGNFGLFGYVETSNKFDISYFGNVVIDNATVTATATSNNAAGIFLGGWSRAIDNVTVKNSTIIGKKHIGGIVGSNYGDITNCTIENTKVTCTGSQAGGIVGISRSINVKNCTVKGTGTDIHGPYAISAIVARCLDEGTEYVGHDLSNNTVEKGVVIYATQSGSNVYASEEKGSDANYIGYILGQDINNSATFANNKWNAEPGSSDVKSVEADDINKDNVFFDLSGRRLSTPQMGINIINGKKVTLK